jgi:hypothetical protein
VVGLASANEEGSDPAVVARSRFSAYGKGKGGIKWNPTAQAILRPLLAALEEEQK